MAGVAFKKTFSYAGFEMQPKKYQAPKIALLNVELELKAEKDNAEVRVNTVEVRAERGEPLLPRGKWQGAGCSACILLRVPAACAGGSVTDLKFQRF